MKRKVQFNEQDVFAIPLEDGSFAVAQILRTDGLYGTAPSCVLFSTKFKSLEDAKARILDLSDKDAIAVLSIIMASYFETDKWHILGQGNERSFWDWIDRTEVSGSSSFTEGAICHLMNAVHGEFPWDGLHDPNRFDELLMQGIKRPKNIIFKKEVNS